MLIALLTTALAWTPTPEESKLLAAVSARDGAPACDVLDATVSDPVATYEAIVEHVEMPPWAPMQAARCLIQNHSEASRGTLESWLGEKDKAGLAKLVVLHVKHLPESLAVDLTRKAMAGPHQHMSRDRLADDVRPAVQAALGAH
jgi:hypothetical protein